MAGLHFDITGDNSNFLRKLDEARNGVRSTSKQIEESGTSIEQMFGRMAKGATALGAGFTAKEIVSNIVRVRGEFQQLEVAFNTMLGSKEKSNTLMQQLVKTAATTPFDLQSVAKGAKQLLAYGSNVDNVNNEIVTLGNVAAGVSVPLGDLVYLYGTLRSQGRAYSVDIRQFAGRGVPIYAELAKVMGVNVKEVNALIEAGKVGFPQVEKAFKNMTSAGGMFNNLMQEQSKTITGQISNIGDSISMMYNNIGKSSEGMINDALSGVSYLVANYEQVGKTVLELAATYGAYKAVLMSVSAYQSFATGITYSVEIAELSKLIPLKQQSANQDVIAAVASGKLTQSKAEQVIALRAEVNEKLQSLQATAAQTAAENASAMSAYKSATQRMLVAKQNMALAQSQMQIAISSGTAEEIAAAKKNAQTASLELNNAAVAKNTSHKSLNIAATNSKSASEALNTLETGKNSVAQTVNTTSTNILTTAKTRLAAASRALGLSMLANPYVLAAAAVAGLAYGIYKLATAETLAEKATRKHREEQEKFQKTIDDRKQRIEELIRIIQDETETEYAKVKAYDELQRLSPALTNAYTREQLAVALLADTNKQLNEVRDKENYDNIISNVNKYAETLSKARKEAESLREDAKNEKDSEKAANLSNLAFGQDMAAANAERNLSQWQKDLDEYNRLKKEAEESAKPVEVKLLEAQDNREQILQEFLSAKMTLEEEQRKIQESGFGVIPIDVQIRFDNAKAQLSNIDKTIASLMQGNTTQTYKEAYNTAQREWKAAQKALEESKKKSKVDYDKAKKDLDDKEKAYKDLGGSTNTSKQGSAADTLRKDQEKYNLLLDKQALEQKRSTEDLQTQVDQARINAMKDGSIRTLEQMKLDHQKEIQQLDRQQEDLLRKKIEDAKATFDAKEDEKTAKDRKHVRQTFDGSKVSLSQSEKNAFDNQKMYLGIKQSGEMQAYLDKERQAWNDYLTEYGTFQEKKDAITTAYNEEISNVSTKGEKASLEKEKQEKIKEVNFDELKSSINFADIFGDLDAQSTESINVLRDKLKDIINKSAKDLKPSDLKSLQEALQNMDLKMAERSPFGELKQGVDKYKDAARDVIKAQEDLNTVQQGGEVIVGSYIDSTGKIVKKLLTQAQAEKNLSSAQSKRQETLKTLTEAANSIGSQGLEAVNAGNQIVDMLGNFGVSVPEAVGATLDGIGQTMSALESIDLTKPFSAITGSIGILTGIGNTIAGLFGFGGADYSGYENMKSQYENLISIWDKLIDKKMEYIDIDYGKEALKAAKEAEDATNMQINRRRQLIKQLASSGASAGSHSLGYRIDHRLSKEDYQRLSDLTGEKITAEYQLWDLSSEQIEKILTDEKLVSVLDTVNKDFVTYLQNIADYGDKLEEIAEKEKAAITGMGFDEFRDGYVDLLSDLDSTNEDFADNFEKYLQKAIFQSLIANEYKDDIQNLYDSWAEAGKDGVYTDDEIKELRNKEKKISDRMLADRDALKDAMGWESGSTSSQEATNGGFQTMSQDTGTELTGRFTALQVSNEEIKNSMLSMLSGVNLISTSTTANGITLMEIRNLAISSNSHLEDISKYTKELIGFKRIIQNIENSAKAMAGK